MEEQNRDLSSEVKISVLVKKRGQYKATITRILNSLSEPQEDTEYSKEILITQKDRLNVAMNNIESLTLEIDDDMDMSEIEDKFIRAMAIITKKKKYI